MIEDSVTVGAVGEVLRSAGLLMGVRGSEDVAVMGVSQDSRTVEPGDLFLAWRGTDVDAHDYVDEAVTAGAAAVMVEHPVEADLPQLVVSDGRRSAALAADVVMGSPSEQLFMVGVTGTNGKTTTAILARHLLALKRNTAAVGTLGIVDADGVRPGTEGLTTPGPVQVAVWLWELAHGGVEAVVMEASSHSLDQRRLDGVSFDVGVFTNLSQDHLDYHKDLASYFGAKARLVELVDPDGTIVVNRGDSAWEELDQRGRRLDTYAVDAPADVRAERLRPDSTGSTFRLVVHGSEADVRFPLVGAFNVENALAAAAIAATSGMDIEEIAEGLATAPQVAGRLEAVVIEPFTVLIDFAHTPDALHGALAALRPLCQGRLIVVFGAGGDRDRTKRRPMAEAVRRFADVIVVTSDNPRTEDPERILDDLEQGLEGEEFERVVDRHLAIRHAMKVARSGDTVVLAGKGHETYQVIGQKKLPFDERVVVREFLEEVGLA
jgi:UDP-N-acetylmuramoyl-L-alanyl-D-glutamate--2,6-diaminopimelate ligase